MDHLLHIFRDLPGFLTGFTAEHGPLVYALLFGIIFAETGLVILPFLPGDSLLFAAGALASKPESGLSIWLLGAILVAAAVLGDFVNYHVGKFLGPRVFAARDTASRWRRLFNRKHLDRAHAFYETYGGKAVVLGRFVPIVRTFVPFVAGAGAMNYGKFVVYNVIGAVLWVGVCLSAGWMFGGIPWVHKHFELVIVGVVVVSLLPVVVEVILAKRRAKLAAVVGSGEVKP